MKIPHCAQELDKGKILFETWTFPRGVTDVANQEHCYCTVPVSRPGSIHCFLASGARLVPTWQAAAWCKSENRTVLLPGVKGRVKSPWLPWSECWHICCKWPLWHLTECKQGLGDNTGREKGAQADEEMHIFHITSAQLSVIVLCKIFLTMLTTQRV